MAVIRPVWFGRTWYSDGHTHFSDTENHGSQQDTGTFQSHDGTPDHSCNHNAGCSSARKIRMDILPDKKRTKKIQLKTNTKFTIVIELCCVRPLTEVCVCVCGWGASRTVLAGVPVVSGGALAAAGDSVT